jgi:hypothetical protein
MQNPFSGLQFAFFACNITFQTCRNDPPVTKDIIQNIFEFGQGLTPPVGAQKWAFLSKVAPLFYMNELMLFIDSFVPPGVSKTEDPAVSWRSVEQMCNLAQKWQFSSPNKRSQTLIKFKNVLYGVYWDQYQGVKTPVLWLNVLFQNRSTPQAPQSPYIKKANSGATTISS